MPIGSSTSAICWRATTGLPNTGCAVVDAGETGGAVVIGEPLLPAGVVAGVAGAVPVPVVAVAPDGLVAVVAAVVGGADDVVSSSLHAASATVTIPAARHQRFAVTFARSLG